MKQIEGVLKGRFDVAGLRVFRILMLHGQLEQKQVRAGEPEPTGWPGCGVPAEASLAYWLSGAPWVALCGSHISQLCVTPLLHACAYAFTRGLCCWHVSCHNII